MALPLARLSAPLFSRWRVCIFGRAAPVVPVGVRRWTKRTKLFDKDYLFIPINEHLHWSLVVVYRPGEWAKKERKRRGHHDDGVREGEGDAPDDDGLDEDGELSG